MYDVMRCAGCRLTGWRSSYSSLQQKDTRVDETTKSTKLESSVPTCDLSWWHTTKCDHYIILESKSKVASFKILLIQVEIFQEIIGKVFVNQTSVWNGVLYPLKIEKVKFFFLPRQVSLWSMIRASWAFRKDLNLTCVKVELWYLITSSQLDRSGLEKGLLMAPPVGTTWILSTKELYYTTGQGRCSVPDHASNTSSLNKILPTPTRVHCSIPWN